MAMATPDNYDELLEIFKENSRAPKEDNCIRCACCGRRDHTTNMYGFIQKDRSVLWVCRRCLDKDDFEFVIEKKINLGVIPASQICNIRTLFYSGKYDDYKDRFKQG